MYDDSGNKGQKAERIKVVDTEDCSRGPLSGCIRLADSSRVIQRLKVGPKDLLATPLLLSTVDTPSAEFTFQCSSKVWQTNAFSRKVHKLQIKGC